MNGDSRLGTFASKTVFLRPEKRGSAHRPWNAARRHQGYKIRNLYSLGTESPPSTLITVPVAYGRSPRTSAATTRPTSSG